MLKKFFKSLLTALIVSMLITSVTATDLRNTHYIDTNGEICTTDSDKFTENGSWTDSQMSGYDNIKVRITSEEGATAVWTDYPQHRGKVEMFVWKSVMRDGDPESRIFVTTNTGNHEKIIDFSKGYSGWLRVGVLNISDVFMTTTMTASGKGVMPVCAIKFVESNDAEYEADRIFSRNTDLMIVKKDSEKCLYNGEYIYFEDAKPEIINNNMMIPIRFVAENMGAEVLWNGSDKSITINKDGESVVFAIDNTSYTVNGSKRTLEQPPIILNSRTMIPLRAMSEGLGYEVDWQDNGIVLIGKSIVYDESTKEKCIDALAEVLE